MTATIADTDRPDPGGAPQLPFDRPDVLTVAPLYDVLRRQGPVVPVRTPAGDPAWLVTRYEEARALFADPRLGRSHPAPAQASRVSDAAVMGGPSGDHATEAEDHARMRKLLTPAFSARRMRRLGEHVRAIVEACLDDMVEARDRDVAAGGGGAVDLHAHLAFPLPVRVICELLGVPFADQEYFRGLSDRVSHLSAGADPHVAMAEFAAYTGRLAAAKRAEPGEDVISDLVAAQAADPRFTDDELTLARLANEVETVVKQTPGAVDVGLSSKGDKPELRVDVNRGLAGSLGLSVGQIAQALRPAFAGVDAGNWVDPTGQTDYVRVRLPPAARENAADLAQLPLVLPGGPNGPSVVPLGQVATITPTTGPAQIEHLNRRRVVTVGANVQGRSLNKVLSAVQATIAKQVRFPEGYQIVQGGQAKDQAEVFGSIGTALGVAVMLMYLILVDPVWVVPRPARDPGFAAVVADRRRGSRSLSRGTRSTSCR